MCMTHLYAEKRKYALGGFNINALCQQAPFVAIQSDQVPPLVSLPYIEHLIGRTCTGQRHWLDAYTV